MSRFRLPASLSFGAPGAVASSRALVLILCLGGCSFLRRPEEPVDRTQDPRILTSVRERLEDEPNLASRDIRVEVDGAIVRLYGSVEGIGEWHCAIRNAQRVPGVLTVVDYLMIERGPRASLCLATPVPIPEPEIAASDTVRGGTRPAPGDTVPGDTVPTPNDSPSVRDAVVPRDTVPQTPHGP